MILTTKEKWVVDKLKRDGFKTYNEYSDSEIMLWKPIRPYMSYDCCNHVRFFINRQSGCRMEYRDFKRPALHFNYYLNWPNKRNWDKINEFFEKCVILFDKGELKI